MRSNSNPNFLKVAIFGFGKMGQHHRHVIDSVKNATLTSVYDPVIANTTSDKNTKKNNYYKDPEKLLSEQKPDVVHICSPPETHTDLSKLALDSGCHIYVEKPFTPSIEDANLLFRIADRQNLKICAGHQILYQKTFSRLPEILSQTGNPIHVESYFSFRQVRKNLSPAGQMIDILPHPAYVLLDFFTSINQSEDLHVSKPFVDSTGEVRCLLRKGNVTGILIVTLRGRPVDSYLKIICDNGSITADFVRNIITLLPGPGSSVFDAVINPYWLSKQIAFKTTWAFTKLAFSKHKNYPGLFELVNNFYDSILSELPSPTSPDSILKTVHLCEMIGKEITSDHERKENAAKNAINDSAILKKILTTNRKSVLVTGGTGFLGRMIVKQLLRRSIPTRVISRSLPLYSSRIPGAEYFQCDLSKDIPSAALKNVDLIIHCAAETSGGIKEHTKNSVDATRRILQSGATEGIKKFVFISSVAVIKSSRIVGGSLTEDSPVDFSNLSRGPYVWGKAESERICLKLGSKLPINVKIIRPGPLVDFQNFFPPGRLGRKIGPIFIAVGPKRSGLPVCDVFHASKLICYYAVAFDDMPAILNLLEPDIPARKELTRKLIEQHPYLSIFWLPPFLLRILSPLLILAQKVIRPKSKAIHLVDAFSSETYDLSLAARTYARMKALDPSNATKQ